MQSIPVGATGFGQASSSCPSNPRDSFQGCDIASGPGDAGHYHVPANAALTRSRRISARPRMVAGTRVDVATTRPRRRLVDASSGEGESDSR